MTVEFLEPGATNILFYNTVLLPPYEEVEHYDITGSASGIHERVAWQPIQHIAVYSVGRCVQVD